MKPISKLLCEYWIRIKLNSVSHVKWDQCITLHFRKSGAQERSKGKKMAFAWWCLEPQSEQNIMFLISGLGLFIWINQAMLRARVDFCLLVLQWLAGILSWVMSMKSTVVSCLAFTSTKICGVPLKSHHLSLHNISDSNTGLTSLTMHNWGHILPACKNKESYCYKTWHTVIQNSRYYKIQLLLQILIP